MDVKDQINARMLKLLANPSIYEKDLTDEKLVVPYDSCYDHDMSCNDFNNKSCYDHDMQVSKSEYAAIVSKLEAWNVYAPKKLVKIYSPLKVKEAITRTEFAKPRIYHAYFRKVLLSIA